MASVDVINQKGEKVNSIELDDNVFNAEIRDTLVQRVVVWQLAKRRSGTASTKTRGRGIRAAERSLGGRKGQDGLEQAPTGRQSGLEVEPSLVLSLAPTLSPFPRRCERLPSDQS